MIKKKFGFTLAEVLITLSIIGVVAALTAPALTRSSGNASTGPKLAKVKSSFELANQNLLAAKGCSKISATLRDTYYQEANVSDTIKITDAYINELSKYWRISKVKPRNSEIMDYHGTKMDSLHYFPTGPDGVAGRFNGGLIYFKGSGVNRFKWKTPEGCYIELGLVNFSPPSNTDGFNEFRPHLYTYIGDMFVDINGHQKPNRIGKDIFLFMLLDNGTLVPYGWYERKNKSGCTYDHCHYWKDTCNKDGVIGNGLSCTASIFANNYKVIYEE